MLEAVIADQGLHAFLRDSFNPLYDDSFDITPLHEHAKVVDAAGEFEDLLARAAGNHLGAYSRDLRSATAAETDEIRQLFSQPGPCHAFELQPGNVPGCTKCTYSHQFTNWFYGVAWDWCIMATWPTSELLWVGCLTDTD